MSAAVVVCLLFVSEPSLAQEEPADFPYDSTILEEVIVTGTRIKQRDFVTASPLTTIDDQVISFSGQPTIEETLNQMPQVLPQIGRTSNNPSAGNNPGVGGAEVDLRGLGPNRVLVLLNGRRVAPAGTDNRVDLNTIPQFLIERVEIITGGTSAVYGSDAIAGVVNFITRDDYSGIGAEAGFSITEKGDAETYDIDLTYGYNFADDRGNVTVYASRLEREALLASEREFTRTPYYDDWEGNLVESGSPNTPAGYIVYPYADLGSGPVDVTFNPDGTPREFVWPDDLYNYAPYEYLQVPLTRTAAGLFGHYALTEQSEAYIEASYVRNEPESQLAPTPALLLPEVNLDNPVLAPETRQLFADNYTCAPNLACFFMRKRLSELGPRNYSAERDYTRILAGIRGDFSPGWAIDGWVTYTKSSLTDWSKNDASRARVRQGLLVDPSTGECFDPSGDCVPVDLFGEGRLSPEGVAFIRYEDLANRTERTQKLASVFVTGSPVDTWAGPLDIAVGSEWRSDEVHFNASDAFATGDTLGNTYQSSIAGTEKVLEFYGEAVIPLATGRTWARYLGLEVGARHSEFTHAAGAWTYKAGGEWRPSDSLRLRAMYQRSERAPNSGELFEEQRSTPAIYVFDDPSDDPCSASADPVGNGNTDKCVLQGLAPEQVGVFEATSYYPLTYISGGNPDLRPEIGKTWTVGAVLSPQSLPDWRFSVDYYYFKVKDTIGFIDSSLICFDRSNTANVFCENLLRDETGNVAQITELTSNRGLLEASGIDTQIQYSGELPDVLGLGDHSAGLDINVYWTHMLTNKEQENPVTETFDCAGYFGRPCDTDARAAVYPKNKVTSNIRYTSGPLSLLLTWRWIEGTKNAAPFVSYIYGVPDPDLAIPSVGDKHYLNLGFAWDFNGRFLLRLGVNNLLETSPPMMADAVWGPNTDSSLYDVFGRSYFARISAQF